MLNALELNQILYFLYKHNVGKKNRKIGTGTMEEKGIIIIHEGKRTKSSRVDWKREIEGFQRPSV